MMTRGSSFPGKASLGCYINWRSTYHLKGFHWNTWLPNCMVCFNGVFARPDLEKQCFSPVASLTMKLFVQKMGKQFRIFRLVL